MASFTIQPDDIRSGQKAAKIRTLAKQGATQGERMAAQGKTKGPSMPKVKAGDKSIRDIHAEYEPSLVQKILGEEGCGCDEPKCNNTPSGKKCPMHGMKDCSVKEEKDPKGPVKKYKSPKEIATKHNVSVEEIKKQLEMGIKVEGEHTSSKTAARITALQHLDEVPDYYTKLKKVEKKSTTSESVTIEDMFGNKFVEFIDLIKPEDVVGNQMGSKTLNVENHIDVAMGKELDDEGSMILNQLDQLEMHCKRMKEVIKDPKMQVPAWVQSKVTLATDYMDAVANYMSGKNEEYEIDEGKIPVTRQAGEFRYSGRTGEEKAERRARVLSNSPDPQKRRQANKIRKTIKTVADRDTAQASSAARQKLYRGQQLRANDLAKQLMSKEENQIGEAVRLPSEYGNLIAAIVMWRGRTQQLTLFFPQAKMPSKKDVQREVEKIYPGGKVISFGITDIASNYSAIDAPIVRVGYHGGNLGKPGPSKNYVKPMGEEVKVDEDWQSVNRKDKTDGLSQKAVNAYRRENPGSKLQTAVTEKKPTGKRAKRRSSFCSRMKGHKAKNTSAETARDPDSRINKALRRWNCN